MNAEGDLGMPRSPLFNEYVHMIDIHNTVFRNTFSHGFSSLLEVAISNAFQSQVCGDVSLGIYLSDVRESLVETINSNIKMRIERKINNYEY